MQSGSVQTVYRHTYGRMWRLAFVLVVVLFYISADARGLRQTKRRNSLRFGRIFNKKVPTLHSGRGRNNNHHVHVMPHSEGTRIGDNTANICERVICPTGSKCSNKSSQCTIEPCPQYAVCESIIPNRQNVCQMAMETGTCSGEYSSWYYNSETSTCEEFQYTGCGGNDNRFGSKKICQDACMRSDQICRLASETGPCRAAFRRWYFDVQSESCQEFIYGGCRGNDNNFETEQACTTTCSGVAEL